MGYRLSLRFFRAEPGEQPRRHARRLQADSHELHTSRFARAKDRNIRDIKKRASAT